MRNSAINGERRRDAKSLADIIVEIDPTSQPNSNPHSIYRVPKSLREVDPDAFQPKTVALGPYHARGGDLEEMEDQKRHCLRGFLDRVALPDQKYSSINNVVVAKLEYCRGELRKLESQVRLCYCGEISMDPERFTEMMLLDGCFVLEVLLHGKSAVRSPSEYHLVVVDMLMLENQIPFLVLEKLLGLTTDDAKLADRVFDFAYSFMGEFARKLSSSINPCHLLHQIYLWMIPREAKGTFISRSGGTTLGVQAEPPTAKDISIPGAVALREAGLKFRVMKNGGAPLAVTFQNGVLEMSALKIYEHHRFLVRNLVALEHCFNERTYVTDHVFLTSRLMSTARDVALLHDKGVMVNGLGSEEEVAQLAGSLSRNVVWNLQKNELREVFLGIDRHRNVRRNRWKATWVRDYFGSPWSIISLLAASCLLLFTLLQTIFAVLSYFKDDPHCPPRSRR